jgi:hypothetical protein
LTISGEVDSQLKNPWSVTAKVFKPSQQPPFPWRKTEQAPIPTAMEGPIGAHSEAGILNSCRKGRVSASLNRDGFSPSLVPACPSPAYLRPPPRLLP